MVAHPEIASQAPEYGVYGAFRYVRIDQVQIGVVRLKGYDSHNGNRDRCKLLKGRIKTKGEIYLMA